MHHVRNFGLSTQPFVIEKEEEEWKKIMMMNKKMTMAGGRTIASQ
jgi:hypothetical protein